MKVCFLYTPNQMVNKCYYTKNIWKNYSKNAILVPPLGMVYLAALMRDKGYDASFIDANILNLSKEQIIEKLHTIRPDYVLYNTITDNLQDTISWIREIKKEYDKPVIIGGPHMEIYPRETLTHECIDYGVVGDGWETLPELLDALEHKKDITKVKGLVFRKDGEIIMTESRAKTVSLEDVPFPARDLLPNEKYDTVLSKARPITLMITALGCPFNCTYCCTDTNLRARSAEHIIAEVEECVNRHGIREIEFYDETFTVNRKKMNRFLDLVEEKGLKFYWSVRTRVDCVDRELIGRMAKNGCIRINFGIESGDENVLRAINRNMSIETIRKSVKWSREAGIMTFGFFMIGLPQDTKESIEKTLNLMLELDLDFIQLNKFTMLPHSKIYEDYKKETGKDFWRDYTLGKASLDEFKRDYLKVTDEELDTYLERGYRKFYYRPKYIWQKLLTVNSFNEFKRLASGALSLLGSRN
jgi:anaerobic magnesium-protoporphyrin IX monomethyl ester cyclase